MNKDIERRIEDAKRVLDDTFLFDNPWDMECDFTPYTFLGKIDWNYKRGADEEWTFMLSRFGFMPNLAISYLYTKDERFIEKGMELISSFIEENPFSEEKMKSSWRTLDSAIRAHNWLLFYNLCSTSYEFPGHFKRLFDQGLEHTGSFLKDHHRTFLELSNWGSIGYGYLAEIALTLGQSALFEEALTRTLDNLHYSVLADGMQFEQSPMYHVQVLFCVLDLINALKRAHKDVPTALREIALDMSSACIKGIKPNISQFLQADSDDTSLVDLFTYAAITLEDGRFKYFGLKELIPPFTQEEIELYHNLPIIKPTFTTAFLETSGNYYLRSGWEKESLCTHFKCGSLGSGHGHADLFHLDITKGDVDILTDSGRFTYTETEERYELKRSKSHNTITVDDKDCYTVKDSWLFPSRPDYAQGLCKQGKVASYVSGLNFGYYPTIIKREIVQVRDLAVFIFDTITSDRAHTYKRYFHFDNAHKVELDKNIAKYDKATLYLDDTELTKIDTLYSKHYNELSMKETVVGTTTASSKLLSAVILFDSVELFEKGKVHLVTNGKELENSLSYTIKVRGNELNLLYTTVNEIKGIDFITNDKVKGYGRIIVKLNDEYEAVIC